MIQIKIEIKEHLESGNVQINLEEHGDEPRLNERLMADKMIELLNALLEVIKNGKLK